jgi:single-strand DNA-binding protein
MNVVVVQGTLSSVPKRQVLPSGDELVSYEVTTRSERAVAESVNVVWFDPPPTADGYDTGDEIVVVGRVRRRFFRAGGTTMSRTEVVATRVLSARHRRRVAIALEQAAGDVVG